MKLVTRHPQRSTLRQAAAALLACGVVLATLLGAPPAAFADGDDPAVTEVLQEEATATRGQDLFSDASQGILDSYPDDVVDFAWHDDFGSITVKPGAREAIAAQAAKADVTILIETASVDAVAYNDRSDLELTVLDLVADVEAESFAARYDAATNTVIITAWTSDKNSTDQQINAALTDRSARSHIGVPVQVEYASVSDAPQENSTTQGGEVYGGCTGGFIGNRGSTYGIITSAHCTTKPSKYDGDNTGSTYTASNNRDVRYTVLSGGTPQNKFRYNGSSYRTITSTGTVSTGLLLFKYGKTTGYGSAKIESYKGCVTFTSGNTWCNLYYTEKKVTQGGDSGGPWFVANKGYGFTTGSNSGGTYVTPVAWVGSISGTVTVKKS